MFIIYSRSKNMRSGRGVQIEDVWSAADLVLHAGQRPTIERVRAQLGRGSPNTVAPMLDAWFASLGKRLSGTDKSLPSTLDQDGEELPASVLRAAHVFWGRARSSAAAVEQQAVQEVREALEIKTREIQDAQESLQEERRQLDLRTEAVTATLEAKDQQIASLLSQLREVQQALSDSRHELTSLKAHTEQLRGALDTTRLRIDDLTEQHRKDRQQVEDRSVAQEHRLLEELDRTRQELKRAKLAVSDEKRRLDTTQANFTEKVEALKLRVDQEVAHRTQLELELMAAQATVQATESRAENLQQLAAKQRASLGIKLNKGLAAPKDLKPRIRKLVPGKKWSKTP